MALHNFDDDLEWSKRNAREGFWETVYRQAFPDFESMSGNIVDLARQRQGIDRVITLAGGAQVFIDEKVQKAGWTSLFLEKWSSVEHQKPGWIEKPLHCDYIAFAFLASQVCHVIPFQQLRRAWLKHERAWTQRFGTIPVKNKSYTTIGIPVPLGSVLQACQDAMWTSWRTDDGLPW